MYVQCMLDMLQLLHSCASFAATRRMFPFSIAYLCVYICSLSTYACVCVCVCVLVYVCLCVSMYVHPYICVCIQTSINSQGIFSDTITHTETHTHTYTHTFIHKNPNTKQANTPSIAHTHTQPLTHYQHPRFR